MITQQDLAKALHLSEVKRDELEALLFDHFHGASENGANEVFYPTVRAACSVELKYSEDGGLQALAGQSLSPEEMQSLRLRVEMELLATGPRIVARRVLFSTKPLDGYFSYTDRFQILPVPLHAPRARFLMAEHPFLLEAAFNSSPNDTITRIRGAMTLRELELVLNTFLLTGTRSQEAFRYHWVLLPRAEGDDFKSDYLTAGYYYPGLMESRDFTTTVTIPRLKEVDHRAYFEIQTIVMGQPFEVPSTLADLFTRFFDLTADDRETFLRACHWFQVSSLVHRQSRSASFISLVSAVEALLPPSDWRGRVTRRFIQLVERFSSGTGNLLESRRRFYQLRSSLTHGRFLLPSDRNPWAVGLNPEMSREWGDLSGMQKIVRLVLVNWLLSRTTGSLPK